MPLPALGAILARIGLSAGARAAAGGAARGAAGRAAAGGASRVAAAEGSAAPVGGARTKVMEVIHRVMGRTRTEQAGNAFQAWRVSQRGGNQEQEAQKVRFHEVLKRGSNFGDIMGGKLDAQEAQQSAQQQEDSRRRAIEGDQRLAGTHEKMTGIVKKATFGLAAVPLATVGFIKALHAVDNALMERQRNLAQYSGSLTAAFAQLDRNRIRRDIERARGTAGRTAELGEAIDDLEATLQPYLIGSINLLTTIATGITRMVDATTEAVDLIPFFKDAKDAILKSLRKDPPKPDTPPLTTYMQQVADAKFYDPSHRRAGGGGP